jgi:GNAT superfamily N-acetyltransferase
MITVRPAAASDEPRWRELFTEYGVFYETAFAPEVLDRVWTLLISEGSGIDALVAESDGAVVGIAHYRSHPDTFSGNRDWFLDDLFTDPAARGQGAATALIEEIMRIAETTAPGGVLRWITASDNERAQRVYDRIATRTTWLTYEKRF